jgi:hypothetical protein
VTRGPAPADPPIPRLSAVTVPDAAAEVVPGAGVQESEHAAQEQAWLEARLRLRRGRIITAAVAAGLVLVLGLVALLGGFKARKDLFVPVAVGSVITTGPFEVTIEKATVRHSSFQNGWLVEVSGTARTTGDDSIAPETGSSGFVYARSTSTREVQASKSFSLGTGDIITRLHVLAPGLPAVPWTLDFTFAQAPGAELLVVVFEQEYTTPWIFGREMGWRPGRHGSTMTIPLEQLPDA